MKRLRSTVGNVIPTAKERLSIYRKLHFYRKVEILAITTPTEEILTCQSTVWQKNIAHLKQLFFELKLKLSKIINRNKHKKQVANKAARKLYSDFLTEIVCFVLSQIPE